MKELKQKISWSIDRDRDQNVTMLRYFKADIFQTQRSAPRRERHEVEKNIKLYIPENIKSLKSFLKMISDFNHSSLGVNCVDCVIAAKKQMKK